MRKGACKHFNGIQNDECAAGIRLDSIPRIRTGGVSLPCLRADGKTACSKWEEPGDGELLAAEEDLKRLLLRLEQALPWINAMKAKFPNGTHREIDTCPVCGKTIAFRIASNHHMAARCETENCITFIE